MGEPTLTAIGSHQRKFNLFHFMIANTLMLAGFLAGCGKKHAPDLIPNPQGWFIESYDNGVITVQHEGDTYKATCDISRSFNNAPSVTDENNVVVFHACDMAIGLVGTNVQPFEGQQKDAKGTIIVM